MIKSEFSVGQEVWDAKRKKWLTIADTWQGFGTWTYEMVTGESVDEGYLRHTEEKK